MSDEGKMKYPELVRRWPYIVRWEEYMGGGREYMMRQLRMAEAMNAPDDAIHLTGDTWSRLGDIRNEDIRAAWSLPPLVPETSIEAIIERLEREFGKPVAGDAYWYQQLRLFVNRGLSTPRSFYWFQCEQYDAERAAAEIGG